MELHDAHTGEPKHPNQLPQHPLRYTGGDLGLGNDGEPWIYFIDQAGQRYLTHSTEWVLHNLDSFLDERDRIQLLSGAALHYGMDAYALMGRRGYQDYLKACIRSKPLPIAAMRYGLNICPLTGRTQI